MNRQSGFVAALSVIAFAIMLMILPVAFFLMGQPHDQRSKASEGENGQVATAPGFVIDSVYVDSSLPNKSLAGTETLWADGQSIKISYLKFNLMPLAGKPFKIAKLRLFVSHTAGPVQNVYSVSDVSWQGHGVTFSSRPVLGEVIGKISGGKQGEWVEVDLTAYAKRFVGKQMAVAIGSGNINGLGFNSTLAPSGKPELVVE
jgi:hypothetical protein